MIYNTFFIIKNYMINYDLAYFFFVREAAHIIIVLPFTLNPRLYLIKGQFIITQLKSYS
jgi:hypothetical protein